MRFGVRALTCVAAVGLLAAAGCAAGPVPGPRGPLRGGPVAVPERGAYLGAYVRPEPVTQAGRIAAVAALERHLGRRLDIIHAYRAWHDPFGTVSDRAFLAAGATLLYSWAGTDTRAIAAGRYDRLIARRAEAVRATRRPVLLEWRWEMDRPNLRGEVGSGAAYVAAWRHIRAIFAAHHVRNAAWVWCPTADGFAPGGDAADFYPGDGQVDWLCVDAYPGATPRSLATVLAPFRRWATGHRKPVIVGEFGVPRSYGARRAGWLRAAAATLRANRQIRAACYYDSDPVRDKPVPGYALHGDPAALAAFTDLARQPYFNPRHPRPRATRVVR